MHEIKHDGYRLMVRRTATGVRILTASAIAPGLRHIELGCHKERNWVNTRWIKTHDHQPTAWQPKYSDDDDWLLLSGDWVIGRVLAVFGDPRLGQYSWTLTGPQTPQASISTRGTADSAEAGKAKLLASWRLWQQWAGMTDAD